MVRLTPAIETVNSILAHIGGTWTVISAFSVIVMGFFLKRMYIRKMVKDILGQSMSTMNQTRK